MAYSTPTHSQTFSNFIAMSQGHWVFSLPQLQSTLAAKRKGDSCPQKGNAARKRRGKSDTNHGTKYKAAKKRRGKIDTKDDAKYDDKEDVLSITDVPFGVKLWRRGAGLSLIQPQSLRRGGARLILRMMPNMMTNKMFFLSQMRLLE
jgi:hypothetical protein